MMKIQQSSVEIQKNYLSSKGKKSRLVLFSWMALLQQTAGARTAYRDLPDPKYQVCFAWSAELFFGRAVGSVFSGYPSRAFPSHVWNFGASAELCMTGERKITCQYSQGLIEGFQRLVAGDFFPIACHVVFARR